ncbi:hypothetical protein ACFL05_00790 [Patescibacteria group bacterium]
MGQKNNMPKINTNKNLGSEGTISFKLMPIENDKEKLYLIDVGLQKNKDRITLIVVKNASGGKDLMLKICNKNSECLGEVISFPEFQVGSAFDVDVVWSSVRNIVAVFVNDESRLIIKDDKVIFENLGNEIHYGEDILGGNKSEMTAE